MGAEWTEEPWELVLDTEHTEIVELKIGDYRRAESCVNALANRTPSALAPLEAAVEALECSSPDEWSDEIMQPCGMCPTCQARARLAEFRGEG